MDTTTHFKISIPKPCHEDWNKFTPDEKGAFCKVCSKSVYDFTKKSTEEIQTILVEQISAGAKVCGRFNEDQLTPVAAAEEAFVQPVPDLSPYTLNFRRMKKFAFALFLVFGGFLFNSVKSSAQKMGKVAYREPTRGEVAVYHEPTPVKDSATTKQDSTPAIPKVVKCSKANNLKGDVKIETIEEPVVKGNAVVELPKGQVAIVEPVVEVDLPMVTGGVSIVEEPVTTLGSVAIMQDPVVDMGQVEIIKESIFEDSAIVDFITIEDMMDAESLENEIMGAVIALPDTVKYPVITEPFPSDSLAEFVDGEFSVPESTDVAEIQPAEEKLVVLEPSPLKIECYPNPTSNGIINIKYSAKENGQTSLVLYDMNGNIAKTLVAPQAMYAADYQTRFDVSDLRDGIYFCELISGNSKTTSRIVISK